MQSYCYYGANTDFDNIGFTYLDAVCQPDESVVFMTDEWDGYKLVKYLPDGARDMSYGVNGYVVLPAMTILGTASTPGNRTLVYGYVGTPVGEFYLLAYEADGSPATDFGVNGLVHIPAYARCHDVQALDDGRTLCRTRFTAGPSGPVLAMFDASGDLDGSFGTGGTLLVDQLDLGNPRTGGICDAA